MMWKDNLLTGVGLNNYKKAIVKAQFAKKRDSRFYIEKNSLLYLKYIKKVFNDTSPLP